MAALIEQRAAGRSARARCAVPLGPLEDEEAERRQVDCERGRALQVIDLLRRLGQLRAAASSERGVAAVEEHLIGAGGGRATRYSGQAVAEKLATTTTKSSQSGRQRT